MYIGNGYVIEAKGHKYGVVKTKLNERPWTTYGKLKWIEYQGGYDVMMLTLEEALNYLNAKGYVMDTEYWLNACKCVKNLEFVFIKWANSLIPFLEQ